MLLCQEMSLENYGLIGNYLFIYFVNCKDCF